MAGHRNANMWAFVKTEPTAAGLVMESKSPEEVNVRRRSFVPNAKVQTPLRRRIDKQGYDGPFNRPPGARDRKVSKKQSS